MAKKIRTKLREKAAEVALDETGTVGDDLKWMAVEAMLDGIVSDKWRDYMRTFADNQEQLARLTLQDDRKTDPKVRSSCAYIVANAVCGTQTGTQTHKQVEPEIDADIPLPGTPLQ